MVLPGALASGFFVCFKGFKYYDKKSLKIIPQKFGKYKRLLYLCIINNNKQKQTPCNSYFFTPLLNLTQNYLKPLYSKKTSTTQNNLRTGAFTCRLPAAAMLTT